MCVCGGGGGVCGGWYGNRYVSEVRIGEKRDIFPCGWYGEGGVGEGGVEEEKYAHVECLGGVY